MRLVRRGMGALAAVLAGAGVIAGGLLLATTAPGPLNAVPEISFRRWSFVDEWICPARARRRIVPAVEQEARERRPVLEAGWREHGPGLLAKTTEIVGKRFAYDDKEVGLFLCPALPGWGLPTMVPLTPYLKTIWRSGPLWTDAAFTGAVWHELLHMYVLRILGPRGYWGGRLRAYAAEPLYTKFHLHLYAVQKAVLLARGEAGAWQDIVTASRGFGPAYARAIDIVENDGYEPFVEELRAR